MKALHIRWHGALAGLLLFSLLQAVTDVRSATLPPRPRGAVPSVRQLQWQELEYYGPHGIGIIRITRGRSISPIIATNCLP